MSRREQRGHNWESTYIDNRFLVLDMIRRSGPLSKSDIAEMTGLTSMTAGNIINDLCKLDLITGAGIQKSKIGRRPQVYAVAPGPRVCISVDLSSDDITLGLVDVLGNLRVSSSLEVSKGDGTRVLHLINALNDFYLQEVTSKQLELVGVAVAVPGIINSESGVVVLSVPLDWQDVPLKTVLEQVFPVPVYVGKETHASIVGEYYFGTGSNAQDILFVNVGSGIGVGVMIGNKIHNGANQMAGELGHVVVDPNEPKCNCGNRGCLERMASLRSIVDRATEAVADGESPLIAEMAEKRGGKVVIADVFKAFEQDDHLAVRIVQEAAGHLARGLVMLKRLFDPEIIIVGGNAIEDGKPYCETILRYFRECLVNSKLPFDRETAITFSRLGDKGRLLGASSWAFNNYFASLLDQSVSGKEREEGS